MWRPRPATRFSSESMSRCPFAPSPVETGAETVFSLTAKVVPLLESIEDLVDLVLFDPNAGIGDFNLDFMRRGIFRGDRDASVRRREFHAVLDQIPKDLLQSGGIAFDVDLCRT